MKYKVKVTDWYLKRLPDGKLPVRVGNKVELIGKGDEVITENIQGLEGDPRYNVEEIKAEKRKIRTLVEEVKSSKEKLEEEKIRED